MLKIAFFTEAGAQRGYGHLIRSYTIYEEFKHLNAIFFVDSDINFDSKFDNITYFKWHNLNIDIEYDIIFIDSYVANLTIYKLLQKHAKITIYLDDYARLEYPPGVIVNFAPNADKLFYQTKKKNYTYLLGMKYIPIRPEFSKVDPAKKEQLFIMIGGADTANLSLEIMKTLEEEKIKKIIVHNNSKTVEKLKIFRNTEILFNPTDMKLIQSMKESSLAITTASMSAYELSFLQIPTIIIATADNHSISQMTEHHIASYAVSIKDKNWLKKLKQYIQKESFTLTPIIDSLGSKRIFTKVMELV